MSTKFHVHLPIQLKMLFPVIGLVMLTLIFYSIAVSTNSNSENGGTTTPPNKIPKIGNTEKTKDILTVKVDRTCADIEGTPTRNSNTRVIDFILINDEIEILEIRMRTLYEQVDYFIIAECQTTFQGRPKPLHFSEALKTTIFDSMKKKIIHVIMPELTSKDPWQNERDSRDIGFANGILKIQPPIGSSDLVFASDIDEIPRPSVVHLFKVCKAKHKQYYFASHFYYFSYQFRRYGIDWNAPHAVFYTPEFSPSSLRNTLPGFGVQNAGWHCTFCFATVKQVITKLESFSHAEYNQEKFRKVEHIVDMFRYGFDLFERGERYYYVHDNQDVPDWVAQNRERYSYMLNRSNEYAGFLDLKEKLDRGEKIV